jgi:hypothetical protein
MLEFLQNMEGKFLSYRVSMMKSFNSKGTYMILSFELNFSELAIAHVASAYR